MGIHFISGKPGGGKGLYSMKLIVEELRSGCRAIVTNLAVKPPDLAAFLHEKYGETFGLLDRLTILEDENLNEFFLYRGKGIPKLAVVRDAKGQSISFDIATAQAGGGVFYLLDEVHLAFGAREWMNVGKSTIYYASQHRKLGDDVILVTQEPKNVEKQFRSLSQDCTLVRNHGMEKLLLFKQPSVFSRQTFINTPPAPAERPQEVSGFKLDKGLGNCYATAAGIGIHNMGAKADIGKDRRSGLHWSWFVVAALLLICGLVMVPKLVGGGMARLASGGAGKAVAEKIAGTNPVSTNSVSPAPLATIPVSVPMSTNSVIGFSRSPISGRIFFLADGLKLSEASGHVLFIRPDYIETITGVRHPVRCVLD